MGRTRSVAWRVATGAPVVAALVLGAGCAAGTVSTTGASGSLPSRSPRTAGTLLVVDPAGENAASGLGRSVAVIPPTTEAPSTTAAPVTTAAPTTLAPPPTTPRVTTGPTFAPTTQSPVSSVTIPSGKPALAPISLSSLSADEQAMVGAINMQRSRSGLGAVSPEQHATDTARQHTAAMIAAGQPINIDDVFSKVNAQYRTITQLTFNWPADQDATQFALSQYSAQIAGPFTSVGVGVAVSGGQRWVTVLLGA